MIDWVGWAGTGELNRRGREENGKGGDTGRDS